MLYYKGFHDIKLTFVFLFCNAKLTYPTKLLGLPLVSSGIKLYTYGFLMYIYY